MFLQWINFKSKTPTLITIATRKNKYYPGGQNRSKDLIMIDVVAAVISQDDLILCFKKGESKFDYLSHKFEFPGGKVEANEDHRQALKREIDEELETDVEVGEHLLSVEHQYPDFAIRLHFYACKCLGSIGKLTEHVELKRLPISRLKDISWLPADVPAVDYLIQHAHS